MRVGIVQSNYVPWRGYFDFIDDVDVFVTLDDVQYTDRDWRNRNRLKTARGLEWMSVSVGHTSRDQLVQDITIEWGVDWVARHLNLLRQNYRVSPYFDEVFEQFGTILALRHERLSELNLALMSWIMDKLSIATPLVNSATLPGTGRKSERLVSLVQALGGTTYVSGPSAEAYLDVAAFARAGISVEYKSYDYQPYPQLWGPFEGAVSVLDLLMNTGPDARNFIKSRVPNRCVVTASSTDQTAS